MDTIKINEIFETVQGEGQHAGKPVLFVRVSGCNKACDFCDTKYHILGKKMTVEELIKEIDKSSKRIVVWSGGEPMLYADAIKKVIKGVPWKDHHLESNGSIIHPVLQEFEYIAFSPKCVEDAEKCTNYLKKCIDLYWNAVDVKVVTDLDSVGKDLLSYASMVMPLSVYDEKKDSQIRKKVWDYCVENNLKYSPRLHCEVWGKERKK